MTDRAKALREELRRYQQTTTLVGKVVAVDEDNETVDVELLRSGVVMYEVRLKAIINGDGLGIIVLPEEDSTVHVSIIEKQENSAYVSGFSRFKKLRMTKEEGVFIEIADDGKIKMEGQEVHLNGDNQGALIIIAELVKKLNRLESKHNKLLKNFNALVASYNTHVHPATPPSSPGQVSGTTPAQGTQSTAQVTPQTKESDLANDKVKHGNG